MKRPIESDYTSLVAYTRALEEYCDALAQPERELNTLSVCEDIQQLCINGELPFQFEDTCDWIEKGKIPSPPQRKPLTNQQIWLEPPALLAVLFNRRTNAG